MKAFLATLALGAILAQPALAVDAEELYKTKACQACHKIDAQLVGPAYTAVAQKYAGRDDAVAYLAGKIKNGGQGVWGQIPMPPNAVTEEEAQALAEWVMTHQ